MRIQNWDTKLSDYIQKQQSIKFRRGKSICWKGIQKRLGNIKDI